MRKHFKHGENHPHNQIIIRSDMCKTFELNGQCWLKVPSLVPRQIICIPLKTTIDHVPSGTLRLIIRQGKVEVHYQQEVVQADYNAAGNILARLDDQEIGRRMNFKKVKFILQERTDRYRLELTNQGSSYTLGNKSLTECEEILKYILRSSR